MSATAARAVAVARANNDDWDFDSDWDDEVGPSWIKDYTGGVKHRGYPGAQLPAPVSGDSPTTHA